MASGSCARRARFLGRGHQVSSQEILEDVCHGRGKCNPRKRLAIEWGKFPHNHGCNLRDQGCLSLLPASELAKLDEIRSHRICGLSPLFWVCRHPLEVKDLYMLILLFGKRRGGVFTKGRSHSRGGDYVGQWPSRTGPLLAGDSSTKGNITRYPLVFVGQIQPFHIDIAIVSARKVSLMHAGDTTQYTNHVLCSTGSSPAGKTSKTRKLPCLGS